MLTILQARLVRRIGQAVGPLDRASPGGGSIRLWQRHRLHLSGALHARCLWSDERRICHGGQRSATIFDGSRLSAIYRTDVRRAGG